MSIDPQTSNDKGDKNEKNSSKFFFDGLLQRILTEQSQKRLYFKVNQYKMNILNLFTENTNDQQIQLLFYTGFKNQQLWNKI